MLLVVLFWLAELPLATLAGNIQHRLICNASLVDLRTEVPSSKQGNGGTGGVARLREQHTAMWCFVGALHLPVDIFPVVGNDKASAAHGDHCGNSGRCGHGHNVTVCVPDEEHVAHNDLPGTNRRHAGHALLVVESSVFVAETGPRSPMSAHVSRRCLGLPPAFESSWWGLLLQICYLRYVVAPGPARHTGSRIVPIPAYFIVTSYIEHWWASGSTVCLLLCSHHRRTVMQRHF